MKKGLRITLIVVSSFLLALLLFLLFAVVNHSVRNSVKVDEKIENTTGLVVAKGRGLYDEDGNKLILKGVNLGNLFVTEGWISPYATYDMEWNSDSNHYDYKELSHEQFLKGFNSNPNLNDNERRELLEIYYENFFNDLDAKFIKSIGFNCIRIPFYYKNILDENDGVFTLKDEVSAFKDLDRVVNICSDNDLYVVLDLHGCPGSQNGYEHSGAIDYDKYNKDTIRFWYNDTYIDAIVDLWKYVSNHYKDNKTIAMYDLINEPRSRKLVSDKTVWNVYDKIYKVIRENGDNHNIALEGIWSFSRLPNPKKYSWENVTYSYHFYNWFTGKGLSNNMFYTYQDLSNFGRNYEVPVYIGEFTFFDDEKSWKTGLKLYDERHYSWTLWTYKMPVEGSWWTNSWGIINLYNYDDEASKGWHKVNVSTATYDEIKACFLATNLSNTSSIKYSNTYKFLKDYFDK